MKITTEELNKAYSEVNKYKKNGYPTMRHIKVEIERNPLIHQDYFDEDEDFSTTIELEFELNKNMGMRGAYVITTKIDVVDVE